MFKFLAVVFYRIVYKEDTSKKPIRISTRALMAYTGECAPLLLKEPHPRTPK